MNMKKLNILKELQASKMLLKMFDSLKYFEVLEAQ